MTDTDKVPQFLIDLLNARSPSGNETEAQVVVDNYVQPKADSYEKDSIGNRIARLTGKSGPTLVLSGHMDEIGLIITYVDDRGFLYFDTLGRMDLMAISGRRVSILTRDGIVKGVTGRRAIHLQTPEEQKTVPERQNLWIDIGAENKTDALKRIRIGDVAVYDQAFELMTKSIAVARSFDNKAGCYIVGEAFRRLSDEKEILSANIISVATAQEEVGSRGARAFAGNLQADFAIVVDAGYATDHPECDNKRFGEFKLGGGPIITRGPNINPVMFDNLVSIAENNDIPIQLEADPRPTSTEGREFQMAPGGLATALVSIPLRYMHTASEVVDLQDVENTVRLLVAYAKSLRPGDSGIW